MAESCPRSQTPKIFIEKSDPPPQFCKGHRFWALSNLSRKFASCIASFFQRLVRTKDRGMLMISQVPRLAHCYAKFLSSLDIEIDYL